MLLFFLVKLVKMLFSLSCLSLYDLFHNDTEEFFMHIFPIRTSPPTLEPFGLYCEFKFSKIFKFEADPLVSPPPHRIWSSDALRPTKGSDAPIEIIQMDICSKSFHILPYPSYRLNHQCGPPLGSESYDVFPLPCKIKSSCGPLVVSNPTVSHQPRNRLSCTHTSTQNENGHEHGHRHRHWHGHRPWHGNEYLNCV